MPGPEADAALVIHASVLINLLGSGATEEVLALLPQEVLIGHRAMLEQQRLSAERVRGLLLAALQRARMSVPPEDIDWVIELLGVELAEQCPSIRRSAIRRFLRG